MTPITSAMRPSTNAERIACSARSSSLSRFPVSKYHAVRPRTRRQGFRGTAEALPTFIGDRDGFGSGNGLRVWFFVEFRHQFPRAIFFQPGITRIAHYLQQPGPRISTVKAAEEGASAK